MTYPFETKWDEQLLFIKVTFDLIFKNILTFELNVVSYSLPIDRTVMQTNHQQAAFQTSIQ